MKIGQQAGYTKANQQQISEDKCAGGIADLLDLFVTFLWLSRIPEGKAISSLHRCNATLSVLSNNNYGLDWLVVSVKMMH